MPEIPDLGSGLIEVAIRTAIVYLVLLAMFRLAGKREVGQLSVLDLLVLLLIADAVQNAMVGENTTLLGGLIAAGVLVLLDRGLALVADRSKRVRKAIEGEPRMLIRDGAILMKALKDEGVNMTELETALRQHGLEEPEQVKLAVLEPDGRISIIEKESEGGKGSSGGEADKRPGLGGG